MTVLDERINSALLEHRFYRWECGCTQERMMAVRYLLR